MTEETHVEIIKKTGGEKQQRSRLPGAAVIHATAKLFGKDLVGGPKIIAWFTNLISFFFFNGGVFVFNLFFVFTFDSLSVRDSQDLEYSKIKSRVLI